MSKADGQFEVETFETDPTSAVGAPDAYPDGARVEVSVAGHWKPGTVEASQAADGRVLYRVKTDGQDVVVRSDRYVRELKVHNHPDVQSDLDALYEAAAQTVRDLDDALSAARKVRDTADAARHRALREEDVTSLSAQSMSMGYSMEMARQHDKGLVSGVVRLLNRKGL